MKKILLKPKKKTIQSKKKDGLISWPSFKGKAKLVGTSKSKRVTVYVDPSIGPQALQNAKDLLKDSDRIVNANDSIFGTTGGHVNVIVFALNDALDGTGGADHMGCDYLTGQNIEACASFGNSERVSALFEAELSECSMNGNLCGYSNGEALSRWCAAIICNNALKDFATAPAWDKDGRPDFVNKTEKTDQKVDSTGCGVAFISWLMSLGYSINKIAEVMVSLGDSGTLAELYSQLTSKPSNEAFPNFITAVEGLKNGITDDDPFNAMTKANSTISTKHLETLPYQMEIAGKSVCEIKSRRLLPPFIKVK